MFLSECPPTSAIQPSCHPLSLHAALPVFVDAATGRGGRVVAALAAACELAAPCAFGRGIACFVALAALLLLRRAPWRQWAVLAAGLAATLVLLRLDGGTGASIAFADRKSVV